jgi:rhomboid family GlyGly-CTERM serine protease
MLNLPTRTEHITGPLLIATIAALSFIFQSSAYELLVFDRAAIAKLELWRILTGNYLHTNLNHLLLNLGGLLLLWSLHGDLFKTKMYLLAFTFFCVSMSLCLYLFTPELSRYVGLSGALHSLFVWGAIKDIRIGYKSGWGLLIGIAVKVGYEQIVGPSESLAETIGASIAIDAHLFGALMGLCWALTEQFLTKTVTSDKDN